MLDGIDDSRQAEMTQGAFARFHQIFERNVSPKLDHIHPKCVTILDHV